MVYFHGDSPWLKQRSSVNQMVTFLVMIVMGMRFHWSMAMQQEPIDWRYLPYISYIRPILLGLNFREYPHNSYGQKYATDWY